MTGEYQQKRNTEGKLSQEIKNIIHGNTLHRAEYRANRKQ